VAARYLYREHFEFVPAFKLFLAVNHRPQIHGTDYAIWRRVHLVPFEVTIPPEKQDRQLAEKLEEELPGILRWAVDGCLAWQRDGLNPSRAVTAATAQYRDDMDSVGDFIAECCIVDPDAIVAAGRLYAAYQQWCATDGDRPESKTDFGMRLKERGHRQCRSNKVRAWRGLGMPE